MDQGLREPSRSTSERLSEKRYVAAGERAYVMGTADGGFPPLGTQISGEMGGVWAHPIKLLTGYWFAVDGTWLPPARRFTSGAGYIQMTLPRFAGLEITRTTTVEAAPGCDLVIGHTLSAEQTVVSVELDDIPASYLIAKTLRGQEVHVTTTTDIAHTLRIRAR
jgi:hypothetical protein